MAKRKFATPELNQRVELRPLLEKAQDRRETSIAYANHAQFSVNINEIFIDLYQLGPRPGDPSKIEVVLTQRVVIPVSLGKGFATGLANLIAGLERETGKLVPNNREPDPDDTIVIWEEKSDDNDSE